MNALELHSVITTRHLKKRAEFSVVVIWEMSCNSYCQHIIQHIGRLSLHWVDCCEMKVPIQDGSIDRCAQVQSSSPTINFKFLIWSTARVSFNRCVRIGEFDHNSAVDNSRIIMTMRLIANPQGDVDVDSRC